MNARNEIFITVDRACVVEGASGFRSVRRFCAGCPLCSCQPTLENPAAVNHRILLPGCHAVQSFPPACVDLSELVDLAYRVSEAN
ncbi:MAG: hypothetical protein CMJ81_06955 [Planctomycetaceae bacterium]|nr:hypothetical protein [Planctomycetaceae bacterium]